MNARLAFLTVSLVSSLAAAQSVRDAQAELTSAQAHFGKCQNGKLQAEFGPALQRLEASRRGLEKGRREVESARRALEAVRKRIEAGHQMKHASAEEREAKEAQYAQSLETGYRQPMKALEPLVASYVSGMHGYSAAIEKYAAFCDGQGITTASARAFVAGLEPEIAALEGTSKDFVASAGKALAGDMAAR